MESEIESNRMVGQPIPLLSPVPAVIRETSRVHQATPIHLSSPLLSTPSSNSATQIRTSNQGGPILSLSRRRRRRWLLQRRVSDPLPRLDLARRVSRSRVSSSSTPALTNGFGGGGGGESSKAGLTPHAPLCISSLFFSWDWPHGKTLAQTPAPMLGSATDVVIGFGRWGLTSSGTTTTCCSRPPMSSTSSTARPAPWSASTTSPELAPPPTPWWYLSRSIYESSVFLLLRRPF